MKRALQIAVIVTVSAFAAIGITAVMTGKAVGFSEPTLAISFVLAAIVSAALTALCD